MRALVKRHPEQGIWMGRPDGSQAGIRIPGKVIIPGPLSGAVSPYGGYFAYITTTDPSRTGFPFGSFPDLKLNIVPLPDGGTSVQIPLTSPATEPDPNFPSEIQRAMIEQTSFAWSPDGNRLAFIGAQEGSSADLYEYYRGSGEVVRLLMQHCTARCHL